MRDWTVRILMALLVTGVSLAQDDAGDKKTEPAREERTDGSQQGRREELRERIRKAMQLPRTTEEARKEGVPEEEVQEVLKAGREQGIPAGDMQEILETENEELREGRKDNFGAAVQQMKASGLRGRELADAIHAEQLARGMKKPKHGQAGRGHYADEAPDGEDTDEQSEEALERGKGKAKGKGKDKDKSKGR